MRSTSEPATDDAVAELEAAADALDDAEAAVEDVGEADVRRVADAVEEARDLLATYRERATGTGDFEAYVAFQEAVATFVEGLPEDLPERDAFEAYGEVLDQRRLNEGDFEAAREELAPAAAVAELLDDRKAARERYRKARGAVARRLDDVEARCDELARVAELADADLDAPVDALRDPIAAYDDAVREAFEAFRREAPAREVLALAAAAAERALVDLEAPPEALHAYVSSADVGTEPVPQLLSYADHSRSKLAHYVDDPDELKRVVATRQTYLERLDAEPLTVGWPPPTAASLRLRAREYESVVRRFADEETVANCRQVRRLTRRDDYAALRQAAVAREELDADQRRLVRDDTVADARETARAERDRLAGALQEHPER